MRLPKSRALLCTLLLPLFTSFQRPCHSPLSPPLQSRLGPEWPGPVKSPARGSLVSGVATRRRLCSLTGPIHWPWLQPQEAQGHCSVSEVMAGRTKSSRAGGGRERLPRRAGQESLSGLLGYVTTALSRLGTFESHLNWGPIRFRLESSPSRCFHGASPPLQPPPWAPPTLGLWALDSRRSPRGSVAVRLGLGPVPFLPTRLEGGTSPLHLDLAQSHWPFRHGLVLEVRAWQFILRFRK